MDAQEKATLLTRLEAGKRAMLEVLNGVTEDEAARNPASGRWSILQCLEHLAASEDYLFMQILAARSSEAPMVNEKREALILSQSLDRTKAVESPQMARPVGRFSTLAQALDHFLDARERTLRFVESCEADLRSRITTHPIVGTVNCYENLLTIAMHPLRHAKQIDECKSALSQLNG
jgi:hypothetical protein